MKFLFPDPRFDDFETLEQVFTNAAIVNPVAGGTVVLDFNLVGLFPFSYLFLTFHLIMLKGATLGTNRVDIAPVGGGGLVPFFPPTQGQLWTEQIANYPAGTTWRVSGFQLWRSTDSGTGRIQMTVFSLGSNGTINAGDAKISVMKFE